MIWPVADRQQTTLFDRPPDFAGLVSRQQS
jgi:hypothetical protein